LRLARRLGSITLELDHWPVQIWLRLCYNGEQGVWRGLAEVVQAGQLGRGGARTGSILSHSGSAVSQDVEIEAKP
jgi:hypothetical protein